MKLNKKTLKRVLLTLAVLMVAMAGVLSGTYFYVSSNASGRTFDNVADVPAKETGLLLATSPITPLGAHNFYFDNRITAAEELYKAGKIRTIIASGGDYTGDKSNAHGCDEPKAIRDSLMAHGVPASAILLDYDGTRTLNSIAKAKQQELDDVILISQQYHNERAIYQADHLGLNTIGYNALPSHIRRNRIKNTVREVFARVKLMLDMAKSDVPTFENGYVAP